MRLFSNTLTFNRIKDGEDGKPGPSLVYAGAWREDVTYLKDDVINHYVHQVRNGKKEFYLLQSPQSLGDDPYLNNTQGSGDIWRRVEQHDLILARKIQADEIDVESLFAERIQTGNIDILEGATISGELKGVSGTFKELYVLDNRGNKAGKLTFGQDGSFTFTGSAFFDDSVRFDGNIYSQGNIMQQGKTLVNDLIVRGAFGFGQKAAIVVSGSSAKYYYEGYGDNKPYLFRFLGVVGSGGAARYEIPIHTRDDREDNGYVYNLIYFDPVGTHYKYEIVGPRIGGNPYPTTPNIGYEVTLANVNDSNSNIAVFINGSEKRWNGGAIGKLHFIGNLQQPNALDKVGGGWLLEYFYDNNW